NYRAQAYRYEMAAHLRRILASTALHATSGNSLSLMESVFRAIGTFLTNTPANWSSILNTAADVIDEVQTRPEQKPTGEPARFTDQLRRAASVTETVRKIA